MVLSAPKKNPRPRTARTGCNAGISKNRAAGQLAASAAANRAILNTMPILKQPLTSLSLITGRWRSAVPMPISLKKPINPVTVMARAMRPKSSGATRRTITNVESSETTLAKPRLMLVAPIAWTTRLRSSVVTRVAPREPVERACPSMRHKSI